MALASTVLLLLACGVARTLSGRGDGDDAEARRELGAEHSPLTDAYVSTYEVITSFPHDTGAFTQGLIFDDAGNLYESDGLYRKSAVRAVHVQTGGSDKRTENVAQHFGEGIAIVGNKLLQLTWQEKVVNECAIFFLSFFRRSRHP